jgi:DNA primase/DNA-binding MarR family transcriptional regulator
LNHYGLKPDKNDRLLCPFHPDTNPSLQVYPKTNTFCCFSSNCTAGTGDGIQFIQLKENCNKHEALTKAASMVNGKLPMVNEKASEAKLIIETPPLDKIAVLTKAFKIFAKALPLTKKAVEYLQGRGLDYKLHEVGIINNGYHHELTKEFIESLAKFGLLKPLPAKGYSLWAKDCIVFPLKNIDNKIVSLYGRSLTNDSDSRHFYLTGRTGLYPGYPKLTTTKIILTESIIDAASLLQQEAIKTNYEILSLYGTNGLTDEHVKAIIELPQLEEIILMLNADDAGLTATAKHYNTLKNLLPHVRITCVHLPDGEDVNSLLQSHDDPKILSDLIEQRKDFYAESETIQQPETLTNTASQKNHGNQENPINHGSDSLDTTNSELLIYDNCELRIEVWGGIKITGLDRMKVTLKILHKQKKSLLPIRDTLDLYSRQPTEKLVQAVSESFDMNIKKIETTIGEFTNELENYRIQKLEALQPKEKPKNELTAAQKAAAINELKKPNLLKRTNEMIGLTGIVGEEENRLIAYLVYSYRKQGNPLHVMFLGASGSGKTHLQEKISELIPDDDKLEITQITENALYYFKQDELKNKLIIFEDLDGALQIFYPLRELQTKRKISKTVTLKDSKGNLKTITVTVEGPVCISGCTTKEKIYEDNANRCLLLYIDQGKEQDKKIMQYHAGVECGDIDTGREQQYKELFKNMQKVLLPLHVVNPYSKFITLPEQVFKPRRTITLLTGFIKAVTFYYQYQRTVKKDKNGQLFIETTVEDIENGFNLLKGVLFAKSDELTKAAREFLELLKLQEAPSFTAKEIRQKLRLNPSNLKRYLIELERYGYIKGKGNRYRNYEYHIVSMDEYEQLKSSIDGHLQAILHEIKKAVVQ